MSEGSVISDADDDADGEGSDGSEAGSPVTKDSDAAPVTNGHSRSNQVSAQPTSSSPDKTPLPTATGDTAVMMNGLKLGDDTESDAVHFDDLVEAPMGSKHEATHGSQDHGAPSPVNAGEKGKRDHDEYKKRRDADPAFVPNRGGFFMHDHRSAAPGQNGFRPFGRGRGRGRGSGPFPYFGFVQDYRLGCHVLVAKKIYSQTQSSGPADAPWAHDLHESVAQGAPQPSVPHEIQSNAQNRQKPSIAPEKLELPNRSFSGSRQLGNVQVRIFLRGMTEPIVVAAVPVHQHTRLPHHRPPLRRDKPVRISIPEMPIRYIFPKVERSFIFIPRALRPNQQGFGRIRGRGSFNGGYAGFGPLSSRRTSVYAGSGYSPSVALSRRSSLAREMSADGIVSPAAASFPRQPGIVVEAGKPVVRLPPAAEQAQASSQHPLSSIAASAISLPQPSTYPLPENPSFNENRPESLPMHHPKPERTLQVGDIESPATLEFNPPQPQYQQPFHQQVPMQMQPTNYQPDTNQYPHSRHPSHPSQRGTPLQHIPETAIHAQLFQPYPYQQPHGFFPQHFAPPMYYYPPQPGPAPSAAAAPFVPGQQYYYPPPMPQQQSMSEDAATQSQAVPYESGGMVYYYNPADLAQGAEVNQQYPQAPYTAPPVGMGGMMTPPVQYFPPPQVYYPSQGPQQ